MDTVSVVEQQRVVGLASASEVKRKTDTRRPNQRTLRESASEEVVSERKQLDIWTRKRTKDRSGQRLWRALCTDLGNCGVEISIGIAGLIDIPKGGLAINAIVRLKGRTRGPRGDA